MINVGSRKAFIEDWNETVGAVILSNKEKQSRAGTMVTALYVFHHLHCPLLILHRRSQITSPLIHVLSPPCSPMLFDRVWTLKLSKEREDKVRKCLSYFFLPLQGSRGRINNFSLTCLPSCKQADTASSARKYSNSDWAVDIFAFVLIHFSDNLTYCYWQMV